MQRVYSLRYFEHTHFMPMIVDAGKEGRTLIVIGNPTGDSRRSHEGLQR